MKILHIIAGAASGGVETFCLDAIKSLNSEGVCQRIICRSHKHFTQALKDREIEYISLSFSRLKKRAEQKAIATEIKKFRPDIVHCWMSRAASFIPKNTAVPVLGWFGGYYDLKNYKNCNFYMGVTKDIVRHIIERTGKPHRSYVVHTFGTLEKSIAVKKSDFNIPENSKVVLLLSRMHRKKGVDTLLHAASKLENVYFLFAGDGPEIKRYKKLSQALGLNDRVRFLGWRNDRAALLNIADVCVLPSRYKPSGTVIAEAWHSNVALVATRAAGAKQYVTDSFDGLLYEINDSDGLAGKIKSVLENDDLQKNLTRNGQQTYRSLFSKEVVTSALLRAYQHIIRTGKSGSRFIDADEYALSPSLKGRLDRALDSFQGLTEKRLDRSLVCKVAAAYFAAHEDESLVMDAAYIQVQGLYDFQKHTLFQSKIEILSDAEINTILSNEVCIAPVSSYALFTAQ